MSRNDLGMQGSSRLRRALGLGLSGAALVGLVYFEGVSARAEGADAQEDALLADEALDLDEAEDEADEAEDEVLAAGIAVPAPATAIPASVAPIPPPAPTPAAAPDPTAEPIVLAMADIGAAEAAADLPAEPPAPALVAVPDLKGMTLRKARRELKALGLELSVRDEWGDKVDRDLYGFYKVRSQKIEAGTEVEPGRWVRVKARERYQAAMGY